MPVLIARHLNLYRSRRLLLSDLSLSLEAGQLTAVLGPNGAGKSTLIRALSGEWPVQHGEVEILGRPIREWPGIQLARRRAVMPQNADLPLAFSVEEIVSLGRLPWHPHPLDREAIDWALGQTDLDELRHRPATLLSGGQLQRAQLARVLAQLYPFDQPGLMFLDECTAHLDPPNQHAVFRLIRQLTQAGMAVLVVVHDINLAASYADRIIWLREGKLVSQGPVERMLTEPLLEQVYNWNAICTRHPTTGQPVVLHRSDSLSPLRHVH